jgi:esterase/lipase superfamily enzyme
VKIAAGVAPVNYPVRGTPARHGAPAALKPRATVGHTSSHCDGDRSGTIMGRFKRLLCGVLMLILLGGGGCAQDPIVTRGFTLKHPPEPSGSVPPSAVAGKAAADTAATVPKDLINASGGISLNGIGIGNILGGENSFVRNPLGLATPKAAYIVQKVYFGTDRQFIGSAGANVSFGVQRAKQLSYGEVDVSIPRDHRLGQLESPSIWLLQFHDDPAKHVTVLRTSTLPQAAFFTALRTDARASPKKNLLVFVHGFNVSFQDAARRTAQMAYDLGFNGVSVFFSWPSQDQTLNYTVDEQSIIDSEPHLEQFLRDVLKQSDADHIYLIAHSMGNRGLTRALMALAVTDPEEVKRIKEVILAAPDIGTVEFTEQIVPGLRKLGAPITLYASSNDRALALSEKLHGGARAGESGDHLIVVEGIETIDASNTDTDLVGHSYYGDRRSVLADMWYLINGDMPASKRCCLQGQPSQAAAKYWVFMK